MQFIRNFIGLTAEPSPSQEEVAAPSFEGGGVISVMAADGTITRTPMDVDNLENVISTHLEQPDYKWVTKQAIEGTDLVYWYDTGMVEKHNALASLITKKDIFGICVFIGTLPIEAVKEATLPIVEPEKEVAEEPEPKKKRVTRKKAAVRK
jgi:hypothetical protein